MFCRGEFLELMLCRFYGGAGCGWRVVLFFVGLILLDFFGCSGMDEVILFFSVFSSGMESSGMLRFVVVLDGFLEDSGMIAG